MEVFKKGDIVNIKASQSWRYPRLAGSELTVLGVEGPMVMLLQGWTFADGCKIFNSEAQWVIAECAEIAERETKELERKGKKTLGKVNFNPLPSLSRNDLLALVDVALDAGDEDWFNELHERLSALE